MFGVTKAGKQERGKKTSDKDCGSKIMRKQIAPRMQPVVQLAEMNVVVMGSTHLAEMVGRTLFNGREGSHLTNQGIFLRQGTRVVIDNQATVLSRRGPNQELFRNEDKERGTHIYRWVHVLSVNGYDVRGQNLYIREGTFREEDSLSGRTLSPPSGGVRPSIAVAPGVRHTPLLGPQLAGEEGQDIITPEQRSLNRLARAQWVTISADNKTPHLAMMVWGEKIYVAGNTDKVVPKQEIHRRVLGELGRMLNKNKDDRLNEIKKEMKKKDIDDDVKKKYSETQKKRFKMHRKLGKIVQQRYHVEEYQNNKIITTIMKALFNPKDYIVICQERKQAPQKGKQAPIHGEMLILDMLYDEYKALGERDKQVTRRRLKKVFAGGNLQDCIFCHWAFDIFNKVIGSQLGVMVVSSGTHGQIPGKWRIPRWMISEEKAMDMLNRRISELNSSQQNGNLYRIENGVLIYSINKQMRNTMLDESDSE